MRAINADDLIERLDAVCDTSCPYSKKQRSVMCGSCMLGSAFDVVDDMPTLHKIPNEHQWIPCSERLPAYGEDVLISIGGYCNVGHIVPVNEEEQYNWYFSGWYHFPKDVDAWMPLPEPYKEDNNG